MSVTAPITNISRCSLHDGPGSRTVVYFKGCGLRCQWCHNPETRQAKKQILYIPNKCIHCGTCIELCPEHHIIVGDRMEYLREGCIACGRCAEECPSMALSLCGEDKTADQVMAEIRKDWHYYQATGGGVTFSGGECLLYPEFVAELAEKCQAEGIHIAVESAMFVPWENIEQVLPVIDLFFNDLKIPDPEKHRQYTGQTNFRIIENIRKLSNRGKQIILRIPVIPGVNDSEEDLAGFGEIIRSFGSGVKEVELLKYNHLAESKFRFVGDEYHAFAEESQKDSQMQKFCDRLAELCGRPCYHG